MTRPVSVVLSESERFMLVTVLHAAVEQWERAAKGCKPKFARGYLLSAQNAKQLANRLEEA